MLLTGHSSPHREPPNTAPAGRLAPGPRCRAPMRRLLSPSLGDVIEEPLRGAPSRPFGAEPGLSHHTATFGKKRPVEIPRAHTGHLAFHMKPVRSPSEIRGSDQPHENRPQRGRVVGTHVSDKSEACVGQLAPLRAEKRCRQVSVATLDVHGRGCRCPRCPACGRLASPPRQSRIALRYRSTDRSTAPRPPDPITRPAKAP